MICSFVIRCLHEMQHPFYFASIILSIRFILSFGQAMCYLPWMAHYLVLIGRSKHMFDYEYDHLDLKKKIERFEYQCSEPNIPEADSVSTTFFTMTSTIASSSSSPIVLFPSLPSFESDRTLHTIFANNNMCLVWSQLADIHTPPIVTSDFVYVRFIGDSYVMENWFKP